MNLEICPGTTIRSAPSVQRSLIAFHSISRKRIPLRAVYLRYPTNELPAGNSLQKVLADRVSCLPRDLMMYLAVILAAVRAGIKVREHALLPRYVFHPMLVLLN